MTDKMQLEADRVIKTVSFSALGEADAQGAPLGTQITVVVSSELTACCFMTLEPEPAGVAPAGWPVKGVHERMLGNHPDTFINRSPSTTGDDFTEIACYPILYFGLPSESFRHFY